MSDRISLIGLRAVGYHGVLPSERSEGQVFIADVVLHTSIAEAASTDDLGDTIDYSAVAADVIAVLEGPAQHLIETVADHVAAVCLRPEAVERVEVTIHKPQAPVGVAFDDVTVAIERAR